MSEVEDVTVFRRLLYGYDRRADLMSGDQVDWLGRRVAMGRPSGNNTTAYSLNPGAVLSEMGDRARQRYGAIPVDTGGRATDIEKRYGIPIGTSFDIGAERSRRSAR